MKKGAAAKQRKAFALCPISPRDHRPQGGNPNEVQKAVLYAHMKKGAAAKQRKAFALCINHPKGSPTAGR
jgi:hypothetical protein